MVRSARPNHVGLRCVTAFFLSHPVVAAAEPSRAPTDGVSAPTASAPHPSPVVAYGVWLLTQGIPSPLLVAGTGDVGGGMRWQVTPLLYSFGIAESPFRTFVVSPIARHSGSVELHASPEWACCAPSNRTSWILRAGLRLYLPLIEHGEELSWSLGATYHRAAGGGGFGGDLGIYTLSGVIGLNVTVAPALEHREVVTALTIRYF